MRSNFQFFCLLCTRIDFSRSNFLRHFHLFVLFQPYERIVILIIVFFITRRSIRMNHVIDLFDDQQKPHSLPPQNIFIIQLDDSVTLHYGFPPHGYPSSQTLLHPSVAASRSPSRCRAPHTPACPNR